MVTPWTDYPATTTTNVKAVHINEPRAAIDAVGGTPPGGWTDGSRVSTATYVKAKHLLEIHDAIQALWASRGLGIIPPWTSGPPGGPSVGTAPTLIRASDINDVRRWFNYWETWGDLRGVHWFDAGLTDLPRVGWDVESVIALYNPSDGSYNSGAVADAHQRCLAAHNYGLVNVVRPDWQPGVAAPSGPPYTTWIQYFTTAVNTLKDVASLFILGNEPNVEGNLTSAAYAQAYGQLYASKVAGTLHLAAGPAPWAPPGAGGANTDLDWLAGLSTALSAVDGFAIHTYQSLEYGCTNGPTQTCTPNGPCRGGDCGFRRYRDFLLRISSQSNPRWAGKPVYITEFNTHGYQSGTHTPQDDYPTGFMQQAYQEVRNYNTETNPSRSWASRVLNLCWFVDDWRGNSQWQPYALANTGQPRLGQARSDFEASNTATGITA